MNIVEIIKVILMGIVEGVTEWLPISSTGHLILLESLLRLDVSEEFWNVFKVVIQLGAILAVVVLYWKTLWPFTPGKSARGRRRVIELWIKVIIACLPAAIIGIPLDDILDRYLSTPTVVAIALIFYGIVFIVIESRHRHRVFSVRSIAALDYRTALLIGLFQCLSLIPGTSRSGATIIGAMLLGCSRTVAAEFSFFLGVPVMFGASFIKIVKHGFDFSGGEVMILVLGMLTAFIVAVFSISFLMAYIRKHDFRIFGIYRIVLGIIVLVWFMGFSQVAYGEHDAKVDNVIYAIDIYSETEAVDLAETFIEADEAPTETAMEPAETETIAETIAETSAISTVTEITTKNGYKNGDLIGLDSAWTYAGYSAIHTGAAVMYTASSNRKDKIIAVGAGHGTQGGSSVKTLCHPDGTTKVTGGSTAAGSTYATAVSTGMTFLDGTPEATVTLQMARILKDQLLAEGYDVLMLRDDTDVQLDNIARTVIANNTADIHIALHWDSDGLSTIKGAFYMSVPDGIKYMEPVASHWQEHEALGDSLIAGLRAEGIKIWGSNPLDTDLTQTCYSTIPSVDIELGNQCSDHSDSTLSLEARGLVEGINMFFGY